MEIIAGGVGPYDVQDHVVSHCPEHRVTQLCVSICLLSALSELHHLVKNPFFKFSVISYLDTHTFSAATFLPTLPACGIYVVSLFQLSII
jgi:hypothetical protein